MFGHRGVICRWLTVPPKPVLLWFPNLRLCSTARRLAGTNWSTPDSPTRSESGFLGESQKLSRLRRLRQETAFANVFSIKYHGLVLVDQHSMIQMRADGLSENGLLQVLSFANQVFDCLPVTDPHDVLGDNRTLIKRGRDIVRCRPDNLDPPGVSLMVRPASREGRQKTVMNIDDRDSGLGEKLRSLRICM